MARTPGRERQARSKASLAAREAAARAGEHSMAGLWTDHDEIARRLAAGKMTALEAAQADAAADFALGYAVARRADGVDAGDLSQLGSVSRELATVAAARGRSVRALTAAEQDGSAPEDKATFTVRVRRDDTRPATAPTLAHDA